MQCSPWHGHNQACAYCRVHCLATSIASASLVFQCLAMFCRANNNNDSPAIFRQRVMATGSAADWTIHCDYQVQPLPSQTG